MLRPAILLGALTCGCAFRWPARSAQTPLAQQRTSSLNCASVSRAEVDSAVGGEGYVTAGADAVFPNGSSDFKGAKVVLVGAGPGDPGLLTLTAAKYLEEKSALVIADRLVSAEVLELVRGELRIANKAPGCAETAQEQIYRWMAEGVQEGRRVVRLKIGDPFVFGRAGEEILWARENLGITPEVVPGVSSAFAAPMAGLIPVTHRGAANSVIMSTGYGRNGSAVPLLPYHEDATAVFLMAVGRLRELCEGLKAAGYPEDCPAAIVERATTPKQRTFRGDITTLPDIAVENKVKAPAVIVVGEVVRVLADSAIEAVEQELQGEAIIIQDS